jgi:KamA family protein
MGDFGCHLLHVSDVKSDFGGRRCWNATAKGGKMKINSINQIGSVKFKDEDRLPVNLGYESYTLKNFRNIPQIRKLSEDRVRAIEIVGQVLPFKTNNYVIDNLIDWNRVPDDPMFILNFPQKEMLLPEHYQKIATLYDQGAASEAIERAAMEIRWELNPHPAGQKSNIPTLDGLKLKGSQHKYRETVLFFPSQGQTCHAYCTFCFRWPQFVGMKEIKFAMNETDLLLEYIHQHSDVTDLLFTGGDPLIMKTKILAGYIESVLDADFPHLKTIRIGTKALGYWPYRFVSDDDADELIGLFEKIIRSGRHVAIMAHFNHPRELETDIVREAISRIRETGAEIRTQSPVLRHINDQPEIWARMWQRQVELGCIPYYMFVARNTGAQHYFSVTLENTWHIFRGAYKRVSGLARTARGPSMSAYPGKIQILGVSEVGSEKVFVMRMLQGRNPEWVARPFFAKYDPDATWFTDLKPAFDQERFFFEAP